MRCFSVKTFVFCLTGSLMLACVSCGNPHNLYPVSGKVTCNGLPASGAVAYFYRQGDPATQKPTIIGVVQQDGSFELVSGTLGKGAPPGDYDVLIEWKRVPIPGRAMRLQTGRDVLHGRYADPKRPLLHATIEAKATSLPPFELTDATANRASPVR